MSKEFQIQSSKVHCPSHGITFVTSGVYFRNTVYNTELEIVANCGVD